MTYSTLFKRNQIIIFSCLLSHQNYQFIEKMLKAKSTHMPYSREHIQITFNYKLFLVDRNLIFTYIYYCRILCANVLNFLCTWYMTSIKIYILLSLAVCFIFHFFKALMVLTSLPIVSNVVRTQSLIVTFREWKSLV